MRSTKLNALFGLMISMFAGSPTPCDAASVSDSPAARSDQNAAAVSPSDPDSASQNTPPRPSKLSFRPLSWYGSGTAALANGKLVSRKDWRSLFVAITGYTKKKDGSFKPVTCSSTLVGPGTLLTAAHCLDTGGAIPARPMEIDFGNFQVPIICVASKIYLQAPPLGGMPRSSADFAFCTFDVPAATPAALQGVLFESVDRGTPTNGQAVLMTGFGCAVASTDNDGTVHMSVYDGNLRIGDAALTNANDAQGYLEIISDSSTKPALCEGDSGGPLMTGATVDQPTARRRVIAVNSSIDTQPVGMGFVLLSRLAPVSSSDFQSFFDDWIKDHKDRYVCGMPGAPKGYPCGK